MKENNSFESVNSNDNNEIENDENKEKIDNSINSNDAKTNIENNLIRKSTLIDENKLQIKKSIIFSNANRNTDNTNFFGNTLTQSNSIKELNIDKKNSNQKYNFSKTIQGQIYNMNLDKDKTNQRWLDISDKDNTKITLIKIIDQNYYEGHLKLKNNLNTEYIIFKIINDKPCYSITPSLYYIEPGKEITINIKCFEKLTINETKNIYDYILLLVAHTENPIDDVNDAKIYVKKEDLYSPDYQLYNYTISLDYGFNPNVYKKEVEENENILNQYKNQLNMNNINDIEEVKKYIDMVKEEIKEYDNKIKILKSILGDINKKNIIKQEETIFDKETYYELSKGKSYKELDDEDEDNDKQYVPLTLVILCFSICLFIGRYLKFILWKK